MSTKLHIFMKIFMINEHASTIDVFEVLFSNFGSIKEMKMAEGCIVDVRGKNRQVVRNKYLVDVIYLPALSRCESSALRSLVTLIKYNITATTCQKNYI